MATPAHVRDYLSAWFQLGKAVVADEPNGSRRILPNHVLNQSGLSTVYETVWAYIQSHATQCHLEGTEQTIADLLSDSWDLEDCYRCGILAPIPTRGRCQSLGPCPCADLAYWPSDETLPPRPANERFNNLSRLERVQSRLSNEE